MPIYKQTTGITKIDDVWANIDRDIVEVYFGDKNIFTVWGEYDGSLPITINADGNALIDYRIYVADGGVGERTENLWNGDEVTQIQVTSDASIVRYGIAFSGSTFSLCLINADSLMYYKIKTGNTYGLAAQLSVGVVKAITLTDNQTLLVYGENLTNTQHAIVQINSGTSYIPYGYKLPMVTRSENLWNPNSRTTNQVGQLNWGVVLPAGTYTIKNDSSVIVYFRDGVDTTTAQRFANAGETVTKTVTNELVAWCNSSQNAIMLNSGSTPLPYEPYSRTDTPVYIGENQLDAGEYVSYGEQKIYKRTANLFDKTQYVANYIYISGKAIVDNGEEITAEYNGYSTYAIPVTAGETYTLKGTTSKTISNINWLSRVYFLNDQKQFVMRSDTFFNSTSNSVYTFTVPNGIAYIELQMCTVLTYDDVMLVEGSTVPEQYIPYLQPTDPPVPLPEIPTIDGTTVIDYDETPKPSQMYIKYRKQHS